MKPEGIGSRDVEGRAPGDLLFGDVHGFKSDAKAVVVAEKMAGDDVRDAELMGRGLGIGIGAGESLRHAERADAQSRSVAERSDGFVGQGGGEVVEFSVVGGVLK